MESDTGSTETPCSSQEATDWISSVPDDVLILIISRLSFKEAARTSILSHRWRRLWTHTPSLDFDGSETVDLICDRKMQLESTRHEYIQWVHRVIAASRAPVLDRFKVHFYLDSRNSHKIDTWVHFAMKRRVRELELACLLGRNFYTHYEFRSCIVGAEINYLTALRLEEVDISCEDLKHLLSKCVLLEELSIGRSELLSGLEIAPGPPLRLKHISLVCRNLQAITIAAPTPDLMSLEFSGFVRSLNIEYAPKLIDLSIRYHPAPMCLVFQHLIHYCSQIQTLSFALPKGWRKLILTLPLLPDMPCLKHLTLQVDSFNSDTRLYGLTSLVKIAPNLRHLTIKWCGVLSRLTLKMKRFYRLCHPSLRVLELRGFDGSRNSIELAKYLLSIANSPEKLIIDLRDAYLDEYYALDKPEELEGAVNHALELREVMAPQVKLVVRTILCGVNPGIQEPFGP